MGERAQHQRTTTTGPKKMHFDPSYSSSSSQTDGGRSEPVRPKSPGEKEGGCGEKKKEETTRGEYGLTATFIDCQIRTEGARGRKVETEVMGHGRREMKEGGFRYGRKLKGKRVEVPSKFQRTPVQRKKTKRPGFPIVQSDFVLAKKSGGSSQEE